MREAVPYVDAAVPRDDFRMPAENRRAIAELIAEFRTRGVLAHVEEGDGSADQAINQLEYALAVLKHLRDVLGPGGSETRARAKTDIEALATALAELDRATGRVADLVGDHTYDGMSQTSLRQLSAGFLDAGGTELESIPPTGDREWSFPDPLRWSAWSGPEQLMAVRSWAQSAKAVADHTLSAMTSPGREPGTADQEFSRQCFQILMTLAGPGALAKLPPAKYVVAWLELAYQAGGEKPKGSLINRANELRKGRRR